MDIYASDEEKGEDIKRWWRENGRSVITGIVLGSALIFAGRFWLTYQQTQAENAAIAYHQLTSLVKEGDDTGADQKNQLLLSDYSATPYAVFSAFEMATQAVNKADYASAKNYLEWVKDNADLSGHVEIARLRLAKLLLAEQSYDAAQALVTESTSDSFSSLFSELQGDIYAVQGQYTDARAAYQSAVLTLVDGEPRQVILNIKIDDMAVANDS